MSRNTDYRCLHGTSVDKQGIIRAADVNADYTIRPEPSETLSQLRALTK